MSTNRIPNIELQERFPIKDWIGWKVGWLTGWYNPFDRLGELVNPAELGRLVTIQGEYMVNHGRIVQELGGKLGEFAANVPQTKQQG